MNNDARMIDHNAAIPAERSPHGDPVTVLETWLDRIASTYALKPAHKELTAARKLLVKETEALDALVRWSNNKPTHGSLFAAYTAGDLTADELAEHLADMQSRAVVSLPSLAGTLSTLGRQCRREASTHLRAIPETWWLDLVRDTADTLRASADEHADALGINEPRPVVPGVRSTVHPWAPDGAALKHTQTAYHWQRLGEVLTELYDVLSIASVLREFGVLDPVPGRPERHMLMWLNLDELAGTPSLSREFYLANRATGGLGLWTADQLAVDPNDLGPADLAELERQEAIRQAKAFQSTSR